MPATTALTGVRRRVGEKPLESVFRRLCSALSPGRAPWSHLGGLLVVAVDGTTVSTCDSPPNAAAFGRPGACRKPRRPARGGQGRDGTARDTGGDGAGPGEAANPALRLVTLVACGTRGMLDAVMGPVRGTGTGERALATPMLRSLSAGMLLLADRNFYSYASWRAAAATGADLLWRVKASMHLPVVAELPDGSFLARVSDPRAVHARLRKNGQRRRRSSTLGPESGPLPGITVRVIEFALTVTADDGAVPHRTVPADHHPDRLARLPRRRPGRLLRPALGHREEIARPRPHPARPHPGPGPPGTMGLSGHLPGPARHHRPRRRPRRPRSGPDLLHRRPAHHRHLARGDRGTGGVWRVDVAGGVWRVDVAGGV